jgi:hypothetical protein
VVLSCGGGDGRARTQVVASLVGRGHMKKTERAFHDSGSRFTHLHERVKDMAGGAAIGFNKPLFLALKQRGLKVCVGGVDSADSAGERVGGATQRC